MASRAVGDDWIAVLMHDDNIESAGLVRPLHGSPAWQVSGLGEGLPNSLSAVQDPFDEPMALEPMPALPTSADMAAPPPLVDELSRGASGLDDFELPSLDALLDMYPALSNLPPPPDLEATDHSTHSGSSQTVALRAGATFQEMLPSLADHCNGAAATQCCAPAAAPALARDCNSSSWSLPAVPVSNSQEMHRLAAHALGNGGGLCAPAAHVSAAAVPARACSSGSCSPPAAQGAVLPPPPLAPSPEAAIPTSSSDSTRSAPQRRSSAGTGPGADEHASAGPSAGARSAEASRPSGTGESAGSGGGPKRSRGPEGAGSEGADSGEEASALDGGALSEEDAKRAARMARNRESAQQSRARKKMQLDELEGRCAALQAQNTHLTGMVSRLSAENAGLRHQLAVVAAQQPRPQGPMQQLGGGPGQASPMPVPLPVPSMPPGAPPFGYCPMPYGSAPFAYPAPKVPIQKLAKPARPAKAAKPLPIAVPAVPRPVKRARQAAAGTTALLALACCFVLLGPRGTAPGLPGIPGLQLGHQPAAGQPGLAALPVAAGGAPAHRGRVLLSMAEPGGSATLATALPAALVPDALDPFNATRWRAEGSGGARGWGALALRPDTDAQATALQHLKDLAPVALFSDFGEAASGAAGAWARFPADGLGPPLGCREVFSLDASRADAPAARAELARLLARNAAGNGAGKATGGALPLPPVGGVVPPAQPRKELDVRAPRRTTLDSGCDKELPEEVIVSVMLPARRAPGDSDREDYAASVDEIYIVVVKPNVKYSTYACPLNRAILVS